MLVKSLNRTGLALVAVAAVFTQLATPAGAVSEKVKNACVDDYYRFCPAYAVGSPALRQCMRRASRNLSHKCKSALRNSGEG